MEGRGFQLGEMGAGPPARIEASSKRLRRLGEVVETRMPLGAGGGMRVSVLVCRVGQLHLADVAALAAASVALWHMGIVGIVLVGSSGEATSVRDQMEWEEHDTIRIPYAQPHLVRAHMKDRLARMYMALMREQGNSGEKLARQCDPRWAGDEGVDSPSVGATMWRSSEGEHRRQAIEEAYPMTQWNQSDDMNTTISVTARAEAILAVFIARSVFASERGEDQEDGGGEWTPDRAFLMQFLWRVLDKAQRHVTAIHNLIIQREDQGDDREAEQDEGSGEPNDA